MGHADAIFILGVTPRSGTNYLYDLLCSHPGCAPGREPIHEDLFLDHAHLLWAYTSAVAGAWDPAWGVFEEDLPDKLHRAIGEALISFLWVDRDHRLVTKSPSVRNLDRFFTLFPDARLLILMRDGRSVVQSAMATFGWSFDTAAHLWAQGAEEIQRFDEGHRGASLPYRIIRYEHLIDDLEPTLGKILDFLELDRESFDFEAARRLPVRGSSAFPVPGRSAVSWEPVAKDAAFAPTQRWRAWEPALHERFEWIAGASLRHFGYERVIQRPSARWWPVGQRLRDWRWRSGRFARRVGYWSQRRLAAAATRRQGG
jgi:Sulfotransferase family